MGDMEDQGWQGSIQPSQRLRFHLGPRQTKHSTSGVGGLSPFQRDSCDRVVLLPACAILPCISFYGSINIRRDTYTYMLFFLKPKALKANDLRKKNTTPRFSKGLRDELSLL